MIRVTHIISIAFFLCTIGCQDNSSRTGDDGPFVASADSSLTAAQVSRWIRANASLDSISFAFQEAFASSDPALQQSAQNEFLQARERACLAAGLRGGYREYRYITGSLPHPRNRALRDSMGISLHQ